MTRRLLSFCRTPSGMSVLAVIAFVFSVVSFFLSAGVLAIVLGLTVLRRARRSGQAIKGRRMAKAAVVLSILIPAFLFLFAAVNSVHTITPELVCQTNLCRLGKAMLMYANEHNDQLPTPSRWCDLLVSVGGVDPKPLPMPGYSGESLEDHLPGGGVPVLASSVSEPAEVPL